MDGEYATNDNLNVKIDIYWQTHFADSAQAEYCPTFRCVCVRPSVYRRDISYFSNNVYLGMYTIWACMPYESSEYPSNPIYKTTNSSCLSLHTRPDQTRSDQIRPDQTRLDCSTSHQTTLPRDQFVIYTFAQFTAMSTVLSLTALTILSTPTKLTNLTTLTIWTDFMKNPHC